MTGWQTTTTTRERETSAATTPLPASTTRLLDSRLIITQPAKQVAFSSPLCTVAILVPPLHRFHRNDPRKEEADPCEIAFRFAGGSLLSIMIDYQFAPRLDIGTLDVHVSPEFFENNRLLLTVKPVVSNRKDKRLNFDFSEIYYIFWRCKIDFYLVCRNLKLAPFDPE